MTIAGSPATNYIHAIDDTFLCRHLIDISQFIVSTPSTSFLIYISTYKHTLHDDLYLSLHLYLLATSVIDRRRRLVYRHNENLRDVDMGWSRSCPDDFFCNVLGRNLQCRKSVRRASRQGRTHTWLEAFVYFIGGSFVTLEADEGKLSLHHSYRK